MINEKQVWVTLTEQGIVNGEEPETRSPNNPWYVKALLAFSGWLASIFLILSIGFSVFFAFDLFDSEASMLFIGTAMVFGAYFLLSMTQNEFVDHAGLAISLAGQAFISFTIFSHADSQPAQWMSVFALFQILLAFVMPNFVHRVFSAFLACYFGNFALALWGLPFIGVGLLMILASWIWLHEFRYPKHQQRLMCLGYGATLALVYLKGNMFATNYDLMWEFFSTDKAFITSPLHGQILACIALCYSTWHLAKRYQTASSPIAYGLLITSTILICAASFEMSGLLAGVLIILLGFQNSNRTLIGLGIVALLSYMSAYYYFLDITLLQKSMTLLILGLLLLIIRWFVQWSITKGFINHQETSHE